MCVEIEQQNILTEVYENFESKLKGLGAQITRKSFEDDDNGPVFSAVSTMTVFRTLVSTAAAETAYCFPITGQIF